MFCKHCGNSIDNDSKFCSFCGGKVSSIEVANEKHIFLGKAHVEKLYFKKLTFPNAAEEWATIEKWITKEVLSDDIDQIRELLNDEWEMFNPKLKVYRCLECDQLVEYEFVIWLQADWLDSDYKEGFSDKPYNYCCNQCMVSMRMLSEPFGLYDDPEFA